MMSLREKLFAKSFSRTLFKNSKSNFYRSPACLKKLIVRFFGGCGNRFFSKKGSRKNPYNEMREKLFSKSFSRISLSFHPLPFAHSTAKFMKVLPATEMLSSPR